MGAIYHASSGFLAGFFSSLTLCPTELVKCRLQAMREMSTIATNGGGGVAGGMPHVISCRYNVQGIYNISDTSLKITDRSVDVMQTNI